MSLLADVEQAKRVVCLPGTDQLLLIAGQMRTNDGVNWYKVTERDVKAQRHRQLLIDTANRALTAYAKGQNE